jgi:uncharacterized protein YkwD
MTSLARKPIKLSLLVAVLFFLCPLVTPLMSRAATPPVVHHAEPASPPPGVNHLPRVEELIVAMTNQVRRARGLAPLIKDTVLTGVARAYSNDMLVRRFFDHTTPDGLSFDQRIVNLYPHWIRAVGENIWSASGYSAANPETMAREIVDDWMSSPGHRENLLDPDYTHVGVGVSARRHTIRATQEFVGQRRAFGFGSLFLPAP